MNRAPGETVSEGLGGHSKASFSSTTTGGELDRRAAAAPGPTGPHVVVGPSARVVSTVNFSRSRAHGRSFCLRLSAAALPEAFGLPRAGGLRRPRPSAVRGLAVWPGCRTVRRSRNYFTAFGSVWLAAEAGVWRRSVQGGAALRRLPFPTFIFARGPLPAPGCLQPAYHPLQILRCAAAARDETILLTVCVRVYPVAQRPPVAPSRPPFSSVNRLLQPVIGALYRASHVPTFFPMMKAAHF